MTAPASQPKKTIRQLREAHGWTQETLARRLGVGQPAVSAWDRGERLPRRRYILRLAELVGISVEQIALGPLGQHPHAGTRQEQP